LSGDVEVEVEADADADAEVEVAVEVEEADRNEGIRKPWIIMQTGQSGLLELVHVDCSKVET
jgi:hypothetical protein